MAFIKFQPSSPKIGDTVITTKVHKCMKGYFEIGTKVKIIDINPELGYDIEDEYGNKVIEIGFVI